MFTRIPTTCVNTKSWPTLNEPCEEYIAIFLPCTNSNKEKLGLKMKGTGKRERIKLKNTEMDLFFKRGACAPNVTRFQGL